MASGPAVDPTRDPCQKEVRPAGDQTDEARDHEGKLMAGKKRKPPLVERKAPTAEERELARLVGTNEVKRRSLQRRQFLSEWELARSRAVLLLTIADEALGAAARSTENVEAVRFAAEMLEKLDAIAEPGLAALKKANEEYERHVVEKLSLRVGKLFDDDLRRRREARAIAEELGTTEKMLVRALREHEGDRCALGEVKAGRLVVADLLNRHARTIERGNRKGADAAFEMVALLAARADLLT